MLKSPRTAIAVALAVCALAAFAYWARAAGDDSMVATVSRGDLKARLTSSGTLKPLQSITYRSPIPGRDVEIRDLAAEGTHVKAGDIIGYVGETGDTDTPHDHFEWHPSVIPSSWPTSPYGYRVVGSAVNPWPVLQSVC